MITNETLIKVNGLQKSFGDVEVLKDIKIDIKKGEVVVIIGPSGCGKSTFLRTLNLLEEPTGGQILLEGTEILICIAKKSVWFFSSLICFHI